jgi:hypothetical protein
MLLEIAMRKGAVELNHTSRTPLLIGQPRTLRQYCGPFIKSDFDFVIHESETLGSSSSTLASRDDDTGRAPFLFSALHM